MALSPRERQAIEAILWRNNPGTVAAPGPGNPQTVDWFGDWRTTTGTSDAALQDGGKFDNVGGPPVATHHIITATGRGFPSQLANVFECEVDEPFRVCYTNLSKWPTPAIGEFNFLRFYFRDERANGDAGNAGWHPVQMPDFGIAGGEFKFIGTPAGGTVVDGINWVFPNQSYPDVNYRPPANSLNATYRIEVRRERTAALIAKVSLRVYDTDDTTLLWDDDDWQADDAMGDLATRNPDLVLGAATDLTSILVGGNDPGPLLPGKFQYFGAFAAKTSALSTDWIGPYPCATELVGL